MLGDEGGRAGGKEYIGEELLLSPSASVPDLREWHSQQVGFIPEVCGEDMPSEPRAPCTMCSGAWHERG